jgi:hypothetical protein
MLLGLVLDAVIRQVTLPQHQKRVSEGYGAILSGNAYIKSGRGLFKT